MRVGSGSVNCFPLTIPLHCTVRAIFLLLATTFTPCIVSAAVIVVDVSVVFECTCTGTRLEVSNPPSNGSTKQLRVRIPGHSRCAYYDVEFRLTILQNC